MYTLKQKINPHNNLKDQDVFAEFNLSVNETNSICVYGHFEGLEFDVETNAKKDPQAFFAIKALGESNSHKLEFINGGRYLNSFKINEQITAKINEQITAKAIKESIKLISGLEPDNFYLAKNGVEIKA